MEINDLKLKQDLDKLFNAKGADINEPNIVASVITAASKMARCSDIATEEMTVEQLLELYKKNDDTLVTSIIGMGPQYVQSNIGYSTDFNDYGNAMATYNANKEGYDSVYSNIAQRAMSKINGEQIK